MTLARRAREIQGRLDALVARYPSRGPSLIAVGWFLAIDVLRIRAMSSSPPGFDGRLYRAATVAWLDGGDPWAVYNGPIRYAAPPPSLLAMVPFAAMPEDIAILAIIVLGFAGTAWALRRLGLPWWWLAFPPFVGALYNANPQVFLVPLIVAGAAPVAVFVKAYAGLVPLIRWDVRALAATAVLLLLTAPFLPWQAYLTALPSLLDTLRTQSDGGLSAWATPILLPVAVVALVMMGRERAAWWSVPLLWPSTQWYYGSLIVPAATLPAALVVAVPSALTPTLGAVITAWLIWARRPSVPDGPTGPPTVLDRTTT
jgi:hypothetical protein